MVRSKKILFSVIAFILLSLIIVLCLYSYNNLDTASAYDLYDSSSVVEMGFPFSYSESYMNSAFMNYTFSWSGWKVLWYDNIRFAGSNCIGAIDTQIVDFGSFSLPISHYNLSVSNSDYYCIVAFPCSLVAGSSYAFNFVLNNQYAGYVGSGVSIVQSFSYNNGSLTRIEDLFEVNFSNISSNTKYNNYYFLSETINLSNSCDYIGIVFKNSYFDLYFNVSDDVSFLNTNYGSFSFNLNGTSLNDVFWNKSSIDSDFYVLNSIFNDDSNFIKNVTFNLYLDGYLYTVSSNSYYPHVTRLAGGAINWIIYELTNITNGRLVYVYLWNPLFSDNGDLIIEVTTNNTFNFNSISLSMFAEFNASSSFSSGYAKGVADGLAQQRNNFDLGYNAGYSVGYSNGLTVSSNGSFLGLITASIEGPLNAVLNMFDFEILGYNLKAFYLGLFTVAMILFIIKLFLGNVGGKKGD